MSVGPRRMCEPTLSPERRGVAPRYDLPGVDRAYVRSRRKQTGGLAVSDYCPN